MVVGSIMGSCAKDGNVSGQLTFALHDLRISTAKAPIPTAYGLFIASRVVIGSGLAFGVSKGFQSVTVQCSLTQARSLRQVMVSPILLQELPHPAQRQTLAGLFNTFYILVGCSPPLYDDARADDPHLELRVQLSQLGSYSEQASSSIHGRGAFHTSFKYVFSRAVVCTFHSPHVNLFLDRLVLLFSPSLPSFSFQSLLGIISTGEMRELVSIS